MNTSTEERLAEVDRKDAAKYASMETLTHQFNQLAQAMDDDDGAIPEDADFEDSLVHHIEDVRAKLVAG